MGVSHPAPHAGPSLCLPALPPSISGSARVGCDGVGFAGARAGQETGPSVDELSPNPSIPSSRHLQCSACMQEGIFWDGGSG